MEVLKNAGTTLLFLFLTFTPDVSKAADLAVKVIGLDNNDGTVHVALYNKPDHFPDRVGVLSDQQTTIGDRQAVTVFRDLIPGQYAIAVYHDENNDDEFNQGFLGIPLESYGFSNGAKAFLGPPSFTESAIQVPNTGTSTVIDLGH